MLDLKPETIIPAISGLFGVLLGGSLTIAKDWFLSRAAQKKNRNYLSVIVTCALDRFIAGCAEIAADDGLDDGQRDSDGYLKPQAPYPSFTPEELSVAWELLSPDLTFAILDLPYKTEIAKQIISSAFEYGDGPPDFSEAFDERHLQFSKLGLEANEIADRLRKGVGLPPRHYDGWNPISLMRDAIENVEATRRAFRSSVDNLETSNESETRANA